YCECPSPWIFATRVLYCLSMVHEQRGGVRPRSGRNGGAVLAAVVVTAVGLAVVAANPPPPSTAPPPAAIDPAVSERLERHLAKLDITGALAYYDTLSVQPG